MRCRAIFLDRDGVVNQTFVIRGKPYPPENLAELKVLDGVKEAIEAFKGAGFLVGVVTNQPDVALGKTTRMVVDQINREINRELDFDFIEVCFHSEEDGCDCRKPKSGMLRAVSARLDVDLVKSFMIGDRWRDIDAGKDAGCSTVWIESHYAERAPEGFTFKANSLLAASKVILDSRER